MPRLSAASFLDYDPTNKEDFKNFQMLARADIGGASISSRDGTNSEIYLRLSDDELSAVNRARLIPRDFGDWVSNFNDFSDFRNPARRFQNKNPSTAHGLAFTSNGTTVTVDTKEVFKHYVVAERDIDDPVFKSFILKYNIFNDSGKAQFDVIDLRKGDLRFEGDYLVFKGDLSDKLTGLNATIYADHSDPSHPDAVRTDADRWFGIPRRTDLTGWQGLFENIEIIASTYSKEELKSHHREYISPLVASAQSSNTSDITSQAPLSNQPESMSTSSLDNTRPVWSRQVALDPIGIEHDFISNVAGVGVTATPSMSLKLEGPGTSHWWEKWKYLDPSYYDFTSKLDLKLDAGFFVRQDSSGNVNLGSATWDGPSWTKNLGDGVTGRLKSGIDFSLKAAPKRADGSVGSLNFGASKTLSWKSSANSSSGLTNNQAKDTDKWSWTYPDPDVLSGLSLTASVTPFITPKLGFGIAGLPYLGDAIVFEVGPRFSVPLNATLAPSSQPALSASIGAQLEGEIVIFPDIPYLSTSFKTPAFDIVEKKTWTLIDKISNSAYAITTSALSLDEGSTLTTLVTTSDVEKGTIIYYSLSGDGITAEDFSSGGLTGSGIVKADGTFSFVHVIAKDRLTEGTENLEIKLFADALLSQKLGPTRKVSINDTSQSPRYGIKVSSLTLDEGDELTASVKTDNVDPGATVYYSLVWAGSGDPGWGAYLASDGITSNDFKRTLNSDSDVLTGKAVVKADRTFSFSRTLLKDKKTEGVEKLGIALFSDSDFREPVPSGQYNHVVVSINDTSTTPDYVILPTIDPIA